MSRFNLENKDNIPLREAVYKTLRDAILKGELEPGTRLMEIHIASDLGVSRTPVREAIRMLEKEHLAVVYPRKGAEVMDMTLKDLREVIQIRSVLDVFAAKEACDNVTEESLKDLERELRKFAEAVDTDDVRLIVSCDEGFHNVIYSMADNKRLVDIVNSLKEQMYRYRFEYVKDKNVLKMLLREHEQMLDGIRSGDKRLVEDVTHKHLENQYKYVKQRIRGS